MLSIEKCKKVLNKKGENYTTEQVIEIRDFLIQYVEILYEFRQVKNE